MLVLSGPNLDRLGAREPEIYGKTTLAEIHARLAELAETDGAGVDCRQSAHEGELVNWIGGAAAEGFAAIVINPGAYSHTSIALHDAVKGCSLPVVEVHLSNPEAREAFRRRSYVARACIGKISGFGPRSYELGLNAVLAFVREKPTP